MSLRYLLDTNVISEPCRPRPAPAVLANLERLRDEIAISSVVWHELRLGLERLPQSRHRTVLDRYLVEVVQILPILDYDRVAAEWHARERGRLMARGETPPFTDGQIAAVAVTRDLTVVTFNVADFSRFEGLRVDRWT